MNNINEIKKIRDRYTDKEPTVLDALKRLDKRVRRPADIFAYTFGTLSALVMGGGMSLIMTDIASILGIAEPFPLGLTVGIVGMLAAILNYPIYRAVLKSRRKKYSEEIIKLSNGEK